MHRRHQLLERHQEVQQVGEKWRVVVHLELSVERRQREDPTARFQLAFQPHIAKKVLAFLIPILLLILPLLGL